MRIFSIIKRINYLVATLLFVATSTISAIGTTGRAFADAPTSPLYYSGQGYPIQQQCGNGTDTPAGTMLFIFTYGGSYNPTNVKLNGLTVLSYVQSGNEMHIFTTYSDNLATLEQNVNVTWSGAVGNGAGLKISHGCAPVAITKVAPTLDTTASSSSVYVGDTVHDTATLTGTQANGSVTGAVDFYLCGPAVSANPDCTTGGSQVGGDVAVVSGQANSGDYKVTAAGYYCFRAVYTPDNSANYLTATHTNLTTECFNATTPTGTITVTKVVTNLHGGTALASQFPLYVGATSVTSGATNTFTAGQSYTVSENGGPSGYTQTGLTCTDDAGNSLSATFTLALNENVKCTITNQDVAPLLNVTKHVLNQYGGTMWSYDFTPKVNGTALQYPQDAKKGGGVIGDNSVTYEYPNAVAGIPYTISEDAAAGYTQNSLVCVDENTKAVVAQPVVLALGQDVECTITNSDTPASISGTKWEVNSDGTHVGTTGLSGWEIDLYDNNNNLLQSTTTDSSGNYSFMNLLGGSTYVLKEILQSGWTQIYSPASVTPSMGQSATGNDFGNFENATIKGYKWNDVNGDGKHNSGEVKLAGWTIDLYNGNGVKIDSAVTDSKGDYSFTDIAPGTYKVCEEQQTGWVQTYPATKDGCHGVTIKKSNHTYTENFGNQGHGTITVTKYLFPNNDSGRFNLDVDGQTKATNVGFGGTTGAVDVVAGTHNVSELAANANTSLSDYDTYYWCYDGNDSQIANGTTTTSDNLSVNAGETVNCSFENYRHASLTIIKKAYPFGTSQAFTFDVSTAPNVDGEEVFGSAQLLNSFMLDDNTDPTLSNTRTMALAGNTMYTVTEEVTAGWNLVGIDCGSAHATINGATVTVNLDFGQQATCTYTNQQPVVPQVLGESTSTTLPGKGEVLAAVTTLTNTGTSVVVSTILAASLTLTASGVMLESYMQRKRATSDPTL